MSDDDNRQELIFHPEFDPLKDHKINVIGQTWNVKYSNDITELGRCDYGSTKIVLNASTDGQIGRNVYLHEVIHALSNAGYLELSERQVDVITTLLIAFFQDNPQLVDYIFRKPE